MYLVNVAGIGNGARHGVLLKAVKLSDFSRLDTIYSIKQVH